MLRSLIISVGFISFFYLGSNAQDYSGQTPYMVKNFDGFPIKNVYSKTSGGNIEVIGNSKQNRVEMFVSPNNNRKLSKEEIKTKLEKDYEIEIGVQDSILTAKAHPKKGFNWKEQNLNISFKIFVPSEVSTNLETSGGNISLSMLSGADQRFSTSGGNLEINHLIGDIVGSTSGGNIRIMQSSAKIKLSTSGGNVEATNCKGDISLKTSGGNVTLKELSGKIDARTSGGNIDGSEISGELFSETSGGNVHLTALSGSLETETSGGEIHVRMNRIAKFVKINNSGGNVDLSLPSSSGMNFSMKADNIHFNDAQNFKGINKEGELNGAYKSGGIPISVSCNGGSISLEVK